MQRLYVIENRSIKEVGNILNIAEQTVFQRLKRLDIPTSPNHKVGFLKKRHDIVIPQYYSKELAEFFGIMLGDGHISHFQVIVNLGSKEDMYVVYVVELIRKIFRVRPKVCIRKNNYKDVYLGSVDLTKWLLEQGLVNNKVLSQVDIPKWIFSDKEFIQRFIRGFFDTDGSIYKLRYGVQISFTNFSRPLLRSLQKLLLELKYKPSGISSNKIYITRINRNIRENVKY